MRPADDLAALGGRRDVGDKQHRAGYGHGAVLESGGVQEAVTLAELRICAECLRADDHARLIGHRARWCVERIECGLFLIGGDHVADDDAGAKHDPAECQGKKHEEEDTTRTHEWQRMPTEHSLRAVRLG